MAKLMHLPRAWPPGRGIGHQDEGQFSLRFCFPPAPCLTHASATASVFGSAFETTATAMVPIIHCTLSQHNPNFLDKKSFIGENGSRNNTRADLIDKVELPTFLAAGDRVPQEECNLPTAPVGTWKSAAKTEAKPAS